jgi:hypothetical protein
MLLCAKPLELPWHATCYHETAMLRILKFSLQSDDTEALLSGVLIAQPLLENSKPAHHGFINLTPSSHFVCQVPPGAYVIVFNLNGSGDPQTVQVKTGARLLRERTVAPMVEGYGNHWFPVNVF